MILFKLQYDAILLPVHLISYSDIWRNVVI